MGQSLISRMTLFDKSKSVTVCKCKFFRMDLNMTNENDKKDVSWYSYKCFDC